MIHTYCTVYARLRLTCRFYLKASGGRLLCSTSISVTFLALTLPFIYPFVVNLSLSVEITTIIQFPSPILPFLQFIIPPSVSVINTHYLFWPCSCIFIASSSTEASKKSQKTRKPRYAPQAMDRYRIDIKCIILHKNPHSLDLGSLENGRSIVKVLQQG